MRYLILADRHEKLCSRLAINHDVGALQNGIAEETVVVQVLVLDVFQRFFVRGNALQPAEWRHHGQQQMQLRVFRNDRLDRKSTRLNSSHVAISYAVFCLKKKTTTVRAPP